MLYFWVDHGRHHDHSHCLWQCSGRNARGEETASQSDFLWGFQVQRNSSSKEAQILQIQLLKFWGEIENLKAVGRFQKSGIPDISLFLST